MFAVKKTVRVFSMSNYVVFDYNTIPRPAFDLNNFVTHLVWGLCLDGHLDVPTELSIHFLSCISIGFQIWKTNYFSRPKDDLAIFSSRWLVPGELLCQNAIWVEKFLACSIIRVASVIIFGALSYLLSCCKQTSTQRCSEFLKIFFRKFLNDFTGWLQMNGLLIYSN